MISFRQIIRPRSTPFALVLGLLALLGAFGSFSHKAEAAGAMLSSVGTSNGSGVEIGVGVPEYPNSLSAFTDFDGATLISTTSAFTILSATLYNGGDFSGSTWDIRCGTVSIFPFNPYSYGTAVEIGSSPVTINADYPIHCSQNLIFYGNNGAEQLAWIQYVPYDTRVSPNQAENVISSSSMPLEDTHFVIIAGFIIALASMWLVISIFKRKI